MREISIEKSFNYYVIKMQTRQDRQLRMCWLRERSTYVSFMQIYANNERVFSAVAVEELQVLNSLFSI